MDYSLLLGIEAKVQVNSEHFDTVINGERRKLSIRSSQELQRFKRHRFTSPDGTQTYYVSIIDFLQLWNCSKRAEQFAKTTFLRANKAKLSAIEPNEYKKRFRRFMRSQVFVQQSRSNIGSSIRSKSLTRSLVEINNLLLLGSEEEKEDEVGIEVPEHMSLPLETNFGDDYFDRTLTP